MADEIKERSRGIKVCPGGISYSNFFRNRQILHLQPTPTPDSSHWQFFFTDMVPVKNIVFTKTRNKVKLIHHLCPQSTSGTKNPNLLRLGNFLQLFEIVEMEMKW